MRNRNRLRPIRNKLIGLSVLVLTACQSNTVYHAYQPISTVGWDKRDTLLYSLPETIPAGDYSIEIGIRHQASYPYRDLWLCIGEAGPQDTVRYKMDSIRIFLADKENNWKGNGLGGLYQYTYRHQLPFAVGAERKPRTLRILQIMKDNPLVGINDVGIRLVKHND